MKPGLRHHYRTWRAALDLEWVRDRSARIAAIALGFEAVARAQRAGLYLATAREVQTDTILTALQRRGAAVAVPFAGADGYALSWLEPGEPLVRGPHGIPEPAHPRPIGGQPLDVIFVPGLAFDLEGHRLGYGGGHFDRLLSTQPGLFTNVNNPPLRGRDGCGTAASKRGCHVRDAVGHRVASRPGARHASHGRVPGGLLMNAPAFMNNPGQEALRIGLCFDGQLADRLPRETHDLPMHVLITESGIRTCSTPPGSTANEEDSP